jgi:hypothetical protein
MDPGYTTGLSLIDVTENGLQLLATAAVRYAPAQHSNPVDQIMRWGKEHYRRPHILLYENFHIRPGQKSVDPTALKVIGALEDRLSQSPWEPYLRIDTQEPGHAKRKNQDDHPVTDEILLRLGLTASGPDARHIRDTFRHAVTYLGERRHRWTRERMYPHLIRSSHAVPPTPGS